MFYSSPKQKESGVRNFPEAFLIMQTPPPWVKAGRPGSESLLENAFGCGGTDRE